ncbi:MAG: SAM-dependent methyltransferase [Planctomycetota bacterium]
MACYEAGIPYEVVPGITSALAAPCYAGIPPTHRDCTSNIAVVTGHRKKGDTRPIDIPKAGTVIFLMSVGNIKNIIGHCWMPVGMPIQRLPPSSTEPATTSASSRVPSIISSMSLRTIPCVPRPSSSSARS